MTDWKLKADELFAEHGRNFAKIRDVMMAEGFFKGYNAQEARYMIKSHVAHRPTLIAHEDKPTRCAEPKPEKCIVIENQEPTVHDVDWKGNRIVRFGLVGDTHINSKYTQITHLHNIYDLFHREGIKHVYHTGDIDEGEQMRVGHQYECYTQGADEHAQEIIRVYPKRDGITTHYITGNHDASLMKRAGYNIGAAIAKDRADMDYLGSDCTVINLTPNCTMELRHPWDGSAYSLSYKPQKIIESISGGEKTNILAIGHYHKAEYLFYRNVHCFQTGTFCAQTPFMKGKAISAHMGGWIVEIEVDELGHIQRIMPQYIPYYVAIKDDYMNWR